MADVAAGSDQLLTTNARVKERGGITVATYDDLITSLVSEVSAELQKRMGRIVEETTHTEYASGDGSDRLVLLQGPLVTITTVQYVAYSEGVAGARDETLTTVNPYQYLETGKRADNRDGPAMLVMTGGSWTTGLRNYKVVYVAGWDPIPEALVSDTTTAVLTLFNNREAAGLRSKNIGDMSLDMFSLAEIDRALDRVVSLWRYDWGHA